MDSLKIAWLFPDTFYLHGERGNILALERFARLAGLEPKTDKIDFDTKDFSPLNYDVIFCPPGEIVSFPAVLEWLKPYREEFETYIGEGRPMLVTGTSAALWCRKIKRFDGTEFEGMGILKAVAVEKETVYGDDLYYRCVYHGKEFEIIGNQIQMVDFINEGEQPWGYLLYGYGNTGKDREEGFVKNNAVFTNTLAPLLAVHPALAAEMTETAAAVKGIEIRRIDWDNTIAAQSFATKKEFIETKVTRLTNCKEN